MLNNNPGSVNLGSVIGSGTGSALGGGMGGIATNMATDLGASPAVEALTSMIGMGPSALGGGIVGSLLGPAGGKPCSH